MARYLLLTFTFLLGSLMLSAQDASIQGKVTDSETGEPILFGSVALYKNGVLTTGTQTDFDGNYSINPIDPGTYDVEFSYVGYNTNRVTGFVASAGKANILNAQLGTDAVTLDAIVVTEYKVPLIEADNTTQGGTLTSEQVRQLPTRSVNALAATTAGVASADEGDAVNIRGSRSNGTDYYLDGVRVSGRMVPKQDIDQLQVITGGIGARYGDVTGGIISITTKGPSGKLSGGFEVESSQLFDNYDYNLASLNVSGPLLRKKSEIEGQKGEPIIGFRLSGQYLSVGDEDPPAIPVYRAKDDVIASLEAEPLRQVGGTWLPNADFLTNDDVNELDYKPFEDRVNIDLTGKLDFRLAKNLDLTISGTYSDTENQFTPGNWRLLNAHRNPTTYSDRYRTNVRLRHRLGGNSAINTDEDATNKKGSFIQNVSYTLQLGYEKSTSSTKDPIHGDDLFRYGHFGFYDQEEVPFLRNPNLFPDIPDLVDSLKGVSNADLNSWVLDTVTGILQVDFTTFPEHIDNSELLVGYNPSPYNPILSNYVFYADQIPDPFFTFDTLPAVRNSEFSNIYNSAWSGFHTGVGNVYNNFSKGEGSVTTFMANTSFELLPGGSEKGRHNIQFGILYEERVSRSYSISNPFNLWDLARTLANGSRSGVNLDFNNQIGTQDAQAFDVTIQLLNLGVPVLFEVTDTMDIQVPIYALQVPDLTTDDVFYTNIRNELGLELYDFVDILNLDPSQLRLDMFSPFELTNQNFIGLNYRGYDYLGNVVDNVSFNDFFTETDANGVRTFPVGAFRPNYAAAYIQDKFTFRDIIFRVGLRVDRYDANTKVLKDQYAFSEIQNAADFHAANGGTRPGNIGDDFKVYITSPDNPVPVVEAYRDGDTWYDADGTQANSPLEVLGSIVHPSYVLENSAERNIKSREFKPEFSFEDYKPRVNWMPRLAFSFPISDEANFFAHYDILVQRPPSNVILTPLDYFYFRDRGGIRNNPNLQPEKTIDYEVGFQQKLSNSSALKLAAYYRELRDMIQSRFVLGVPVEDFNGIEYQTYDNLDFGTVKGFTVQYDMRRTNNVTLNIAYTLQFADGTGSNANSSSNLSQGIQRALFPLSFDERHRLNAIIDYRYGTGKRYNGPTLFGSDILANAGANLQITSVSGRPYTRADEPNTLGASGIKGAINGSRRPWNFTVNLQVDKSFSLTKPDAARQMNLNVFFRVTNLLDRRNVIGVYRATGSSNDDGYLASGRGLLELADIASDTNRGPVEAFIASYNWRMLNPNNFSLPRRMYIGAIVDF